jgi:hypothetical protein
MYIKRTRMLPNDTLSTIGRITARRWEMKTMAQRLAQESGYFWVNLQTAVALVLFAWVMIYAPPSLLVPYLATN